MASRDVTWARVQGSVADYTSIGCFGEKLAGCIMDCIPLLLALIWKMYLQHVCLFNFNLHVIALTVRWRDSQAHADFDRVKEGKRNVHAYVLGTEMASAVQRSAAIRLRCVRSGSHRIASDAKRRGRCTHAPSASTQLGHAFDGAMFSTCSSAIGS